SFAVNFNFWQLVVPEPNAPEHKKRKKTPGGVWPSKAKSTVPKYSNYNPKVPTKLTVSNPASIGWVRFKPMLFQVCDKKLPSVSNSLSRAWLSKTIDIQGFINGSRQHKAKKMVLEDQETLTKFMTAVLAAPSLTPMGFKIHHENPKITSNANRSLEIERQLNAPKVSSDDSDGEVTDDGSSAILSPGERNHRTLMARFAKDFNQGENITSVFNPKNSSEVMLLNTARVRTWANLWADGKAGVDKVNPPVDNVNFRWIKAIDYEKERNKLLGLNSHPTETAPPPSAATVVNHNYYGQPFSTPVNTPQLPPLLLAGLPNCNLTPIHLPRLSPPPQIPPFEEFLTFAGILPEMKKTRDILAEEGINDFGRLLDQSTYTFANFRSMGIPFAHADDLVKAIPKFNHHLKSI
ncbi:hypothetical protein DFH28DRAFT_1177926, partial [Melampsora americana]